MFGDFQSLKPNPDEHRIQPIEASQLVLVPKFYKPGRDPSLVAKDEAFRQTIANAYPGRRVAQIDVDAVLAGGGGMHCISQQIPA